MTNREAYERDCNELEQYREIGTVEQVRNQKHNLEMAYKIISDYEAIGTVEECREAMEKQKAKKPRLNYKPKFFGRTTYTCPRCGNCCLEEFANERQNNRYCWDCGQKIDFGGSYAKDSLKIVEKGGIE